MPEPQASTVRGSCDFCGQTRSGGESLRRFDDMMVDRCGSGCTWWVRDFVEIPYGDHYFEDGGIGIGYGDGYADAAPDTEAIRGCEALMSKAHHWLEIGAGNGSVAIALHRSGYTIQASDLASGFEPRFATAGVSFHVLDAVTDAYPPEVTALLAIDVFEHLLEPADLLRQWAESDTLQSLLIRVPNGRQMDSLGARSNWLSRNREHVFYPSRQAIGTFLQSEAPGLRTTMTWRTNGHRYIKLQLAPFALRPLEMLANEIWIRVDKR